MLLNCCAVLWSSVGSHRVLFGPTVRLCHCATVLLCYCATATVQLCDCATAAMRPCGCASLNPKRIVEGGVGGQVLNLRDTLYQAKPL